MEIQNCRAAWEHMTKISAQGQVRNFVQRLDMRDYVVETPLFPRDVLDAYSASNMEQSLSCQQQEHKNEQRGGSQGDYHAGMQRKIDNVVDCLTRFPNSKRAVITISNQPSADHDNDTDAKCLRELHFYLDDEALLSGTILLRAQAASIFPKNIHLVGSIMSEIANRLPQKPELGTVFYLATVLVSDRA